MINWIKNFYKKDISIPITLVIIYIVYWFALRSIKYEIATPFIWSKDIYDFILPFIIVFIAFRFIFIRTQSLQQKIFFKNDFLWFIVKIIWAISILYSWSAISVAIPKITTNIIHKTFNLPKYVINPCGYWTTDDLWNSTYKKWTKEQENEALQFWRLDNSRGFYKKCVSHDYVRNENDMF